jgi:hypothetical protein
MAREAARMARQRAEMGQGASRDEKTTRGSYQGGCGPQNAPG